jgi:hypothetical protein
MKLPFHEFSFVKATAPLSPLPQHHTDFQIRISIPIAAPTMKIMNRTRITGLSMINLSRVPIEVMNHVNTVVAVSKIPDMEPLEDGVVEAKTNIQHTPFN